MIATVRDPRRFRVRIAGEAGHHERVVTESTFEAAALSYVEHLPLLADNQAVVRVLVHEVESGHEHSFVIHLDPGERTASR